MGRSFRVGGLSLLLLTWSLSAECGNPTPPCRITILYLSEGTIASPGYPNPYPPHANCTWTIRYHENSTLTMRLLDLDIEEDADKCASPPCCSQNWLSFSSTIMCGKNISIPEVISPRETTSTTVEFHSSKTPGGGRGFKIAYFVCKADDFPCGDNIKCVDPSKKCDGIPDCLDGSDEWHCEKEKNYDDKCSEKNMVPCGGSDEGCYNNITERCNGISNCPKNGTDELNCGICGKHMLYCRYGGCYPLFGACDNIVHCAGGWDEAERGGCGSCPPDYVPCGAHDRCHCYHAYTQRCDGRMDCINGDDEISCVAGCENKIACASVPGCYLQSQRCDGIAQCLDSSDEVGCLQPLTTKFECNSGRCIDSYLVCNEEDDCGDGSDESNCIKTSMITAVVLGSAACGLIAIMGVAMALCSYTSRNRNGSISTHNILPRQDDHEPLDEGSFYHLYREPPPSYQEAIMQGASPPPYWHSSRFVNMPLRGESAPQVPIQSTPRPRSSVVRTHLATLSKTLSAAKPAADTANTSSNETDIISGDQLYPENVANADSDTTILELSDSNGCASASDNFRSQSSSPSGTSCSNLMLLEPVQED